MSILSCKQAMRASKISTCFRVSSAGPWRVACDSSEDRCHGALSEPCVAPRVHACTAVATPPALRGARCWSPSCLPVASVNQPGDHPWDSPRSLEGCGGWDVLLRHVYKPLAHRSCEWLDLSVSPHGGWCWMCSHVSCGYLPAGGVRARTAVGYRRLCRALCRLVVVLQPRVL